LVFSDSKHIILSVAIFVGMFIPLMIFLSYLFYEPFLVFHVSGSDIFGFSLVVIISALTGLVLSMAVYRVRILRNRTKNMRLSVIGSIMGAGAGACGCISMNIAIVPFLLPIAGVITFLDAYAIPLRLISITILGFTYFITVKGITSEYKIDTKT